MSLQIWRNRNPFYFFYLYIKLSHSHLYALRFTHKSGLAAERCDLLLEIVYKKFMGIPEVGSIVKHLG